MLNLQGNSGCEVKLIYDSDTTETCVRKLTYDIDYISRLKKQCQLQENFIPRVPNITSPEVFRRSAFNHGWFFEMKYHNGYDFLSFLETSSKKEIDHVIETLIAFIEKNYSDSEELPFPSRSWNSKLMQIQNSFNYRELPSLVKESIKSIKDKKYATYRRGYCHGDLTLSNVIISREKNELVFIDFLDSFFVSPLQDIVKIRQDTSYFWILGVRNSNVDENKIKIALKYIDNRLDDHFKSRPDYARLYRDLQVMNLLRVLRYTTDKKKMGVIMNALRDLK